MNPKIQEAGERRIEDLREQALKIERDYEYEQKELFEPEDNNNQTDESQMNEKDGLSRSIRERKRTAFKGNDVDLDWLEFSDTFVLKIEKVFFYKVI